jgi:hypothetical protein
MEAPERDAVAFSKTGNPQLGEWADAVILGHYGDMPDDLALASRIGPADGVGLHRSGREARPGSFSIEV